MQPFICFSAQPIVIVDPALTPPSIRNCCVPWSMSNDQKRFFGPSITFIINASQPFSIISHLLTLKIIFIINASQPFRMISHVLTLKIIFIINASQPLSMVSHVLALKIIFIINANQPLSMISHLLALKIIQNRKGPTTCCLLCQKNMHTSDRCKNKSTEFAAYFPKI